MTTHLALQRILLPSAQVSSLTTGSITLPSARGQFAESDFWNIDSVLVGSGGTSSISFTNIPQTYKNLQVRFVARSNASGTQGALIMKLNNDSTNSSYGHGMSGWGGSNTGTGSAGSNYNTAYSGYFIYYSLPFSSAGSTYFGTGIIDIADYASTNKRKTSRMLNGYHTDNYSQCAFQSQHLTTTTAVSSIVFTSDGGGFGEGTRFHLYGMLGG